MPRMSITWRLTRLFTGLSSTVLVCVAILVSLAVERHFEEEDLNEVRGKLELIQNGFDKTRTETDFSTLPQKLHDALIGHHDLMVAVFDTAGNVIYKSHLSQFPDALITEAQNKDALSLTKWQADEQNYRGTAVSMGTANANHTPLVVAIAVNIDHHEEFISKIYQSLFVMILIGIALMFLLGWFAAKRGLIPIRDFVQLTKHVSVSSLQARVEIEHIPEELQELGESFNNMLARLEDSFRRLSEFSSDIAHELRTPVSNLMTQSHVALSQRRSMEEYQEILYSNIEDYERLSRIISDMLFLAKADNGLIVPYREAMDIGEELDAVIEFYEALASEKQLSFVRKGRGHFEGDKLMMRRAFSNLISNAIRHATIKTEISIEVSQSDTGIVEIGVNNLGQAIPEEVIGRIFDRFYRVDPSRQRNTDGTGLGLAITKSIIEAHGGNITASSQENLVSFKMIFLKS